MRTIASDIAFRNPENKERRKSKKELVYEFFKWDHEAMFVGATYPQVAEKLRIDKSTAQKRCADLLLAGKLKVNGIRDGFSIYFEANDNPKLTKPKAYDMAVKTFCDLDIQRAIYNFVKNNT